MKLQISREWLEHKLQQDDDANVGAGGTSLEQFKKDVQQRTVTPAVLAKVPTELGQVVRYVREQRGWSRSELADLADVDESEINALETQTHYDPTPRTVGQLADACHFSRVKFAELANHRLEIAANDGVVRYVAKSKGTDAVSDDQYELIRALVEVLSQGGEPTR
ncbi:helix-turn-helix transcriptional regulator [Acidovorax sp. LjRoot38]|uniref:helix-turn-helix domain-containing protein n=1 Tax=Acidovorax sp. LjRoot38 TaxID=3342327 RepID=UPI003ED12458